MELPSAFQINDECSFVPTFKQQTEMGISPEQMEGKVVAIRFTEAKIFYDVFNNYYGWVFNNVPSEKVFKSMWEISPTQLENVTEPTK